MTINMEFWDDGMVPPTHEFKRLPAQLRRDLTTYLIEGDYGGNKLLDAALKNNFVDVMEHATGTTLECLSDLSMVLYNRCPAPSWGSKERVEYWQQIGGWNGFRRMQEAAGRNAEPNP